MNERWSSWINRLRRRCMLRPRTREDFLEYINLTGKQRLINKETQSMIEEVVAIADTRVREIMVPKIQMVCVNEGATLIEAMKTFHESGHSRLPVINKQQDKITGLLLAKDLLPLMVGDEIDDAEKIKALARPPLFVPESKSLSPMLHDFRKSRSHMAIVINEYGNTSGLVTVEDIIEEIIGNIEDEHDKQEAETIRKTDQGTFVVSALTPIYDFNSRFKTKLNDAEYETIGGLVLDKFGRMPKAGESIEMEGISFKVSNADKRRIHEIEVYERGPQVPL